MKIVWIACAQNYSNVYKFLITRSTCICCFFQFVVTNYTDTDDFLNEVYDLQYTIINFNFYRYIIIIITPTTDMMYMYVEEEELNSGESGDCGKQLKLQTSRPQSCRAKPDCWDPSKLLSSCSGLG